MPERDSLSDLLTELEDTLRRQGLWEGSPPAPETFDSTMPFFADTMQFTQWLQWVFIARFRALLRGGHSLPSVCEVAPMAEEMLKNESGNTEQIVALLVEFDSHFDSP